MKFEELGLSDEVLDALDAMGFSECTPIQEQAIPVVLEGDDLVAVAQTGTGKTAAYLLPVISRLYTEGAPTDAINCIVMAPTRELAQQIDRQVEGFSYYMEISSTAVYGGTDGVTFAQQQRGLKLGADVVIATPGRLLAHLQMGYVDLSRVSYFILDEADRMLDMGFYDDIMQIAKRLPKDRQTLMFSATMPPKIRKLAGEILTNPREVKIAVSRPADGTVDRSERVIVFASSKLKVKDLARALRRDKYEVGEIHSDLEQAKRDDVMLGFRSGRIPILIATDIVARGIDVDDIAMVVNYDVPHEAEDYVHRIGRTARAGAQGRAVTFVSPMERRKFTAIERFLGKEVLRESLPEGLAESASDGAPRQERRNGRPGRNNKDKGNKDNAAQGRKPRKSAPTAEAPAAPAEAAQANDGAKSKGRRNFRRRPKKEGGQSGVPQE
jgi:ATP-dependent RNA helicase RhlE